MEEDSLFLNEENPRDRETIKKLQAIGKQQANPSLTTVRQQIAAGVQQSLQDHPLSEDPTIELDSQTPPMLIQEYEERMNSLQKPVRPMGEVPLDKALPILDEMDDLLATGPTQPLRAVTDIHNAPTLVDIPSAPK